MTPRQDSTAQLAAPPVLPEDVRRPQPDSAYIAILEKTNAQLSLWWNPYGVLIASLGILFTVAAVVAGVIVFRQSGDHKVMISASITKYETVIDALVSEKLQFWQEQYDQSLTAVRAKLLDETNLENRKALEGRIVVLERHIAALRSIDATKISIGPTTETPASRSIIIGGSGTAQVRWPSVNFGLASQYLPPQLTCSKCGTEFPDPQYSLLADPGGVVRCPHCGEAKTGI